MLETGTRRPSPGPAAIRGTPSTDEQSERPGRLSEPQPVDPEPVGKRDCADSSLAWLRRADRWAFPAKAATKRGPNPGIAATLTDRVEAVNPRTVNAGTG